MIQTMMVRSKNTKERIMQATVDLLSTGGLQQCSTRAIARKVEISENTIYRHFADKDDLIHQVFVSAITSITGFLAEKDQAEEKPTKRIEIFVSAVCDWAQSHAPTFRILLDLNAGRLKSLEGIEDPFDICMRSLWPGSKPVFSERLTVAGFAPVDRAFDQAHADEGSGPDGDGLANSEEKND